MAYRIIKATESFIANGVREYHFDCPVCKNPQVIFEAENVAGADHDEYRISHDGSCYPIFVCQHESCNYTGFIKVKK